MKVVIILPTYNEKENLEKLIPILEDELFPKIKDHEMHILIADDNSPDGTAKLVKEFMKKYKNMDINQGEKKGLGAAYIRGMIYAIEEMKADVMFEMDADMQHDHNKIPEFLKKIDEGYDMAIGNRYSNGGSIPKNWPLIRKIYSITGNLVVRTILTRFSIHDWTGGFRALRKEVFLKEKDKLTRFRGYTFQVSFLHNAVKDGFKIAEVPFHFSDRTLGDSKIAPREYIADLLKYIITARIRELLLGKFGKFLVVGGLGFVIDFLLYLVFSEKLHVQPSIASILSAVFAIFSNYNFNNIWTFQEHKITGIVEYVRKMAQFYATSAFGVVVIRSGFILVMELLLGKQYHILYYLMGTGLLMMWNFAMYSHVIWKKKPRS